MAFSDNLLYLRKREKITQEELAEQLQVSRQSVSKWETGEAFPETEKLIVLCDRFNVNMDDLVRGDIVHASQLETKEEKSREEQNKKPVFGQEGKSRAEKIKDAIQSAIMLFATLFYVYFGIVTDVWHPSWVVFPIAAFIDIIIGIFFDCSGKEK